MSFEAREPEARGGDILGGRPAPRTWSPDDPVSSAKAGLRAVGNRFEGMPLFLFALVPLVGAFLALLRGRVDGLVIQLLAVVLIVLGTLSVRRGLRAARRHAAQVVAAPVRFPAKIAGAVLIGAAATLLATKGGGYAFAAGLAFGIGAGLGTLLAYGLDPLTRKGPADLGGVAAAQFRQALDAASARIDELDQLRRKVRARSVADRLGQVVTRARGIVFTIEQKPDTFNRARKLLNTYLDQTLSITRQYAGSDLNSGNAGLDMKFTQALDAMETVMNEQQQKLLAADALDIDVQLEVLTRRLKSEGLL